METYKSTCPDCGASYHWKEYKTELGNKEKESEEMKIRKTVCWECESPNLVTKTRRDALAEEMQGVLLEIISTD